MSTVYTVTSELLEKFKKPFGVLIRGSFAETMTKVDAIVKNEKPLKIISVGDIVSRNLHAHQINPQLSIIDNRCMRKRAPLQTSTAENVVHIRNPPGTITEEAITAIKTALEGDKHVHIIVDGEEDLLTLVAVLYAPENSLIIYGQPYEGIVVVKTTPEKTAEAQEILKAMKPVRKAK